MKQIVELNEKDIKMFIAKDFNTDEGNVELLIKREPTGYGIGEIFVEKIYCKITKE